MEKINKILKYIIVGVLIFILIIIIASYIGISTTILIFLILFIISYFLNKKYEIATRHDNCSKFNIVLAVILFIVAFTIRICLVKLLQIVPESDFALLIDASSQLALRE